MRFDDRQTVVTSEAEEEMTLEDSIRSRKSTQQEKETQAQPTYL
jgi:hypothetical protein